jgi:hypothetical protein
MGTLCYLLLLLLLQDFGAKLLRAARNLTGAWLLVIGGDQPGFLGLSTFDTS